MKTLSRPRTAVERKARRNYMILGVTSAVSITTFVGVISLYLKPS
jgi:hypothetical protein